MVNILLTGRPGIGKTTAIANIIKQLPPGSAVGFLTREIREKGTRVGFEIVTTYGERCLLAHVHHDGPFRVGKYSVDIEAMNRVAVVALEKARASGAYIIIDEIAKMELYSDKFAPEVRSCLDTGRVIGTIQSKHLPFLDEVRSRQDVSILTLTEDSRDEVPKRVLRMLSQTN